MNTMPSPFKRSVQAQSAGEPQGGNAGDYRRAPKSKRTSIFVGKGALIAWRTQALPKSQK
jgi:hypothetical protein